MSKVMDETIKNNNELLYTYDLKYTSTTTAVDPSKFSDPYTLCYTVGEQKIGETTEEFQKNRTIAKFEKVSFNEYRNACLDYFGIDVNSKEYLEDIDNYRTDFENSVEDLYSKIKLPERATKGSAGYDFFTTTKIVLTPGETQKRPTGIRCKMKSGYVLSLYPRSGLGFKYRLQLNNTVGIIDSDYYYSDNEGHIFAKITNDTNEDKIVIIKEGEAFMQGIFTEYFLAEESEVTKERNGGFGSTSK